MSLARRLLEVGAQIGTSAPMAVLCAVLFLFCASSCRSTIVTSEDATLQEAIVASLHGDHLDSIAVVVNQGRATLTGFAPSAAAREVAQRDAEQVDGVKAVVNDVRVEAP